MPQHGDDDHVTLNDIAARAGVGVGSLYDYFADRDSVLSGLAAKVTEAEGGQEFSVGTSCAFTR